MSDFVDWQIHVFILTELCFYIKRLKAAFDISIGSVRIFAANINGFNCFLVEKRVQAILPGEISFPSRELRVGRNEPPNTSVPARGRTTRTYWIKIYFQLTAVVD